MPVPRARHMLATDWWIVAILLLATLALYGRTVGFDYVNYDDDQYVYENEHVLNGLSPGGIRWAFVTGEASNWHPLTWLSLMTDVTLFGPGPAGHHATNTLLHAANAALLFAALFRMTGHRWPSALCAALFAWHPLRVESVAWISERKDVLSGLFWMLTLLAWEAYARRPTAGRYAATALALVLGLLSKPMLVTLPCVLLLLDYWPLRRIQSINWRSVRTLLLEKLPLLAIVASASVVTFLVQRAGKSVSTTTTVPMADRLANAVVSYVEYIRQTLWPAGLAAFYPHPRALTDGQFFAPAVAAGAMALAAGCVAAVLLVRRAPWCFVGWFWFLGTLVPVIGLVQVGEQSRADRYTYLTVIGLTIALAWSLARAIEIRPGIARPAAALAGAALLVLLVRSHQQIGVWRDAESLWRHGVAVVPNSFVGHNNLGEALDKKGRYDEAIEQFRKTLQINPNDGMGANNLGVMMIRKGQTRQAKELLKQGIRRSPWYLPAYVHLGNIYAREGRPEDAILMYRQAIERDPTFVNGYHNLAITLAEQGKLAEALPLWERARAVKPDDPDVNHHYGVALLMSGQIGQGIDLLRQALRTQPDRADTLTRLAWVLATHPSESVRRPQEAVELARRAVELTAETDPAAWDALAAAEAAGGAFDRAESAARSGLAAAEARQDVALATAIRRRLTGYQQNRAYIQGMQ